ncbi:MAG: hypothetical protein ACTSPV_06130 [Candidatus Hodarchaeales archaeon]
MKHTIHKGFLRLDIEREGIFSISIQNQEMNKSILSTPLIRTQKDLVSLIIKGKKVEKKATTVIDSSQDSMSIEVKSNLIDYVIGFKLEREDCIKISSSFSIKETIKIESIDILFEFTGNIPLKYIWTPHLRPKPDYVIPDFVFRSPVLILRDSEGTQVSLVPDLESLAKNRIIPTVLNLDLHQSPFVIGYGLKDYRPTEHIYFKHPKGKAIKIKEGTTLKLDFYLLVEPKTDSIRKTVSLIWERFGREYLKKNSILPQIRPFEEYPKLVYESVFKRLKIWQEFGVNGKECGGTYFKTWRGGKESPNIKLAKLNLDINKFSFADYTTNKIYSKISGRSKRLGTLIERVVDGVLHGLPGLPLIYNNAWYNNIRSAYGIKYFAQKWQDQELEAKADKMKNLILQAPKNQGIFPCHFFINKRGEQAYIPGTRAFAPVSYYHTVDNSWTLFWLLQWYQDLEKDPEIVSTTQEYANFLVKIQLESGAIPTWVKIGKEENIEFHHFLLESASTACSVLFLLELFKVTKNERYLKVAIKGAKFLINEVIRHQKWFDYETFFSCSFKSLDMKDSYTQSYPNNSLSIYWVAESFYRLYLITKEDEYLSVGLDVLDQVLLFQQVWDCPYISINTFGGAGVMNTDAEWNDARQSLFALVCFHYYEVTGNKEYFERGIAFLRASFTLTLIEEHKEIAKGAINDIKVDLPEYGLAIENYGHIGYDKRPLGWIMPDWGSMGASTSFVYVYQRFGDIFIDLKYNQAFGLNACTVENLEIKDNEIYLEVEVLPESAKTEFRIICRNLHESNYSVNINGKLAGKFSKQQLLEGFDCRVG